MNLAKDGCYLVKLTGVISVTKILACGRAYMKQEVRPVHETAHPSCQEIWDCHSPPKEERSFNTSPSAVVSDKKKFKLRNEKARLEVPFLHVILSRVQEENKAKEDTGMEKEKSGRIPSQEMKSTGIYENSGSSTW